MLVWIKKVRSPDVALTEKQARAFQTDREVVRAVRTEPELPQFGSSVVEEAPEGDERLLARYTMGPDDVAGPDEEEQESRSGAIGRGRRPEGGGSSSAPATGRKAQFASMASSALAGQNPQMVSMVANNSMAVKMVMSLPSCKSALNHPEKLLSDVKASQTLTAMIANKDVQKSVENPAMVKAFINSEMMAQVAASPTGRELAQNAQLFQQLITNNPELGAVLTNPNIVVALQNNPATANLGNMASRFSGSNIRAELKHTVENPNEE